MKKSRLKGLKVYLAGTMEQAPDDGVAWRQAMTPRLEELGLVVLDPTNRPTRLSFANSAAEETCLLKELRRTGEFDKLTTYVQEIVHQDLRMVDLSDMLIVYVDSEVPSTGTVDEFVTATNQRKPIFLCCKQGIRQIPLWYWGRIGSNYSQTLYESLDDIAKKLGVIAHCSDKDLEAEIDMKRWFFMGAKKPGAQP